MTEYFRENFPEENCKLKTYVSCTPTECQVPQSTNTTVQARGDGLTGTNAVMRLNTSQLKFIVFFCWFILCKDYKTRNYFRKTHKHLKLPNLAINTDLTPTAQQNGFPLHLVWMLCRTKIFEIRKY
jgi:hypothetical protein